MKKIMFLFVAALAATTWADRTANQGWVARNFAPSNLVGRVEALEHGGGGTETDPVFTNWRDTSTVIKIGADSGAEARAVAIGKYSTSGENSVSVGYCAAAEGYKSVAIGHDASATSDGAVQLGEGSNSEANTLQFKGYRLLNSNGKIPSERLPATPTLEEEDPYFTQWQQGSEVALGGNAEAGGSGSVAVGSEAVASGTGSVAIGDGSLCGLKGVAVGKMAACSSASCCAVGYDSVACSSRAAAFGAYASAEAGDAVQLGKGTNTVEGTLQFRNYQLLDATGKIPLARLGSAMSKYAPLDGTAGAYFADKSLWYYDKTSPFLAIGYDKFGHGTLSRNSDCICFGSDVSIFDGNLYVNADGCWIENGLFFRDTEMSEMSGGWESLDQRITRLCDLDNCIKNDQRSGYDWVYNVDKCGMYFFRSDGQADPVSGIDEETVFTSIFRAGPDDLWIGEGEQFVLDYKWNRMTFNKRANWIEFPENASGTVALTSDINAANVLTAIKAMDATQKAELKAALGL